MTDTSAEVTDLLQHLIRNACVCDGTRTSGGEVRSADLLAGYFDSSGADTPGGATTSSPSRRASPSQESTAPCRCPSWSREGVVLVHPPGERHARARLVALRHRQRPGHSGPRGRPAGDVPVGGAHPRHVAAVPVGPCAARRPRQRPARPRPHRRRRRRAADRHRRQFHSCPHATIAPRSCTAARRPTSSPTASTCSSTCARCRARRCPTCGRCSTRRWATWRRGSS